MQLQVQDAENTTELSQTGGDESERSSAYKRKKIVSSALRCGATFSVH